MSSTEREALTSFACILIFAVLCAVRLSTQHAAGAFTGPDALQTWARSVLVLVVLAIVLAVALSAAVQVFVGAHKRPQPDDDLDERDRAITTQAERRAWAVLSGGLSLILLALAFGASAYLALNLLLAFWILSEASKHGLRLWLYRHGA